MAQLTVMTAICTCAMGVAPCPLMVSSQQTVTGMKLTAGTVDDTTFPTFGMCNNTNNPAVQAATSAASGVFTPAPCVPAISGKWSPGSATVMICGKKALSSTSTLKCSYSGGTITITNPVATVINVP